MKKVKLGIVGATGLVGETFIKLLIDRNLLNKFELFLIASEKSLGKTIKIENKKYVVYVLDDTCLSLGLDVIVFSAGEDISERWAKKFIDSGTYVIDNTNAFRRVNDVPLVVPEINSNLINCNKLIANPNCSTIQLAVVLNQFMKVDKIEKVIVASYQSVSGAGKKAMADLINDTRQVFKYGIKDNIIPAIGDIADNGFCKEENKIMYELNKILNTNISVYASAVRVPIPICHGESVYVKFKNKVNLIDLKNSLKCEYIEFSDDKLFLPTKCVHTNKTYVCRLRQCSSNEIMFFVVADNLRRGASYNALEIVRKLLNNLKK